MTWKRNCRIYRKNKQQIQQAIVKTIQQEVDQGSDRVITPNQDSMMAEEEVFSLLMLDLSATGADNLDINGESLPYLGFGEVDFESDGIPINNAQTSIFLIVPDTTYILKTTILVGTNILRHLIDNCREHYGERKIRTKHRFVYALVSSI